MIDLTPPNPNPASPDNDQDGPKTARAHFLKVFLSQRPQMEALLSTRGRVTVITQDYKRYVGAQIGIYNPSGEKVGAVSHLRNLEYLYVVET